MNIRPYEPGDHDVCRRLYVELVVHHREVYDAEHIGGDDPGSGFDEYVARADRAATWVAVDDDGNVVGMTGLLWQGAQAEVEPVVVSRSYRGQGVGRALIETAIADARRRGAIDLNIRPVARNASAIGAFHALGFRTVGHVQLFMRLGDDQTTWADGIELHGRPFSC